MSVRRIIHLITTSNLPSLKRDDQREFGSIVSFYVKTALGVKSFYQEGGGEKPIGNGITVSSRRRSATGCFSQIEATVANKIAVKRGVQSRVGASRGG